MLDFGQVKTKFLYFKGFSFITALSVRASTRKSGMGFELPNLAAKQKRRQPQKPTGGFKPPDTHQGGCGAVQTFLAYLGCLNCPQGRICPGASIETGLGELAAPNSIGAPSPNAIIGLGAPNAALNQICWVLQQICYQTVLLQN
ncbi:hypothetical protein DSO57_1002894 [Entomophthora muscae]|uniref:Uncharacterized protein n=1 Tax=Entomophthora muscae TaxID=34485 RepID=A0ACC2SLE3_9FUNG|nr:hypothetical protein DSO57_1002894 [Entomophthora muscae]